jgi:predicted signal transduction protein with EAL and GGDEF domain
MSTALTVEPEAAAADWMARFVDDIPAGVAVFDRELRYVVANMPWAKAFRLAPVSLPGQYHHELDRGSGSQFAELLQRALSGESVCGCDAVESDALGQLFRRSISFRPRFASDGRVVGVVAAMHQVATAVREKGVHGGPDRLTGIPGRETFLNRVRAALAALDEDAQGTALLLLDIEDFKGINDLYGTRVGDRVLKSIASRLLTGVRGRSKADSKPARIAPPQGAADLVARLGADEFGIVLGNLAPSLADAEAFARRLLQIISTPIVIGEERIRLTANVGFLITSPSHQSEDDVLRDLNVALQEAKARGPNSAKAWEPALTDTVSHRLALLNELRRALEEGEFVLHYQPIVTLGQNCTVGAEALLRWNHPSEGLIPPQEFLPLLEESGLIVPVGSWIIREVVRQMQVWQMLYGRDVLDWVSINVSARQFNDPSLLLATLAEINDSGFPLDRLKLEITESAVMRNPDVTRKVLGELQEIGIRVALDDFGTGYSALGALRHYSVDMIKIDRDFTTRLNTSDGRELVLALLKIARIYGAAVVAEGVETLEEHDVLHAAGCDFGQGYLFAKPMEGSAFGAFALTHLVESAIENSSPAAREISTPAR